MYRLVDKKTLIYLAKGLHNQNKDFIFALAFER